MILEVILPLLMEHIINSPRVVGWLGRGFEAQNKLINIGALTVNVTKVTIFLAYRTVQHFEKFSVFFALLINIDYEP